MTKLKGKKPTAVVKRLKALFYGGAGAGKTTAAISFPKVYLIDTERGSENESYVKLLEKGGGAIFQTGDFNELLGEVKSLLSEKHDYKTLVIDPLTTLYNDLLDKSAIKNGTDFGKHYNEANKHIKHLLSLLLRLDMNVIITSHAKNEYGAGMTVLGSTFDCYKKLDYLFDLVFEIQKRGKERVAIVKKTRVESFPEGDIFPFSYKEIAARYGRDILERDAVAEILSTPEQLTEYRKLIKNVTKEKADKFLERFNVVKEDELTSESIQKIIDYLQTLAHGEPSNA